MNTWDRRAARRVIRKRIAALAAIAERHGHHAVSGALWEARAELAGLRKRPKKPIAERP